MQRRRSGSPQRRIDANSGRKNSLSCSPSTPCPFTTHRAKGIVQKSNEKKPHLCITIIFSTRQNKKCTIDRDRFPTVSPTPPVTNPSPPFILALFEPLPGSHDRFSKTWIIEETLPPPPRSSRIGNVTALHEYIYIYSS